MFTIAVVCVFSFSACTQETIHADTSKPGSDSIVSYELGRRVGENLFSLGFDLDPDALMQGIRDYQSNAQPKYDSNKTKIAFEDISKEVEARRESRRLALSQDLQIKEVQYLKQNANAKEVKVLKSGVQYEIVKTGGGKSPKETGSVTFSYRSQFVNGKVSEDSNDDGGSAEMPIAFAPNGVKEVLLLLKEGDIAKIVVPQSKDNPLAPRVLIWEIELVSVNDYASKE